MALKNVVIRYSVEKDELREARNEIVAIARALGISEKEAEELNKKFTQMGREGKKAGQDAAGGFGGLNNTLKSLAGAAAGVFAIDRIVDFGKKLLDATANAQRFGASVQTMLGSKQQADILAAQVADFAAKTPFELTEIQGATQKLLAFNIAARNINPTLKAVGDIAAGVGAPIGEIAELYGKAKVQGRLYAEDINQLTGRGIPIIQELAKQFKVSEGEVKKLVEQGKVGFPQLEKAFQDLTGEGGKFFNLMDRQSEQVGGKLSNLSDNFNRIFVTIGTGNSGVIASLLDGLNDIVSGLDAYLKGAERLAEDRSLAQIGQQAQDVGSEIDTLTKKYQAQGDALEIATQKAAAAVAKNAEFSLKRLREEYAALEDERLTLGTSDAEVERDNALGKQLQQKQQAMKVEQERLRVLQEISTAEANAPQERQLGVVEKLQAKLKELGEAQVKALTVGEAQTIGDEIERTQEELKSILEQKDFEKLREEYKGVLQSLDTDLQGIAAKASEATKTLRENGAALGIPKEKIAADVAAIEEYYSNLLAQAAKGQYDFSRLNEDALTLALEKVTQLREAFNQALESGNEAGVITIQKDLDAAQSDLDAVLSGRLKTFAQAGKNEIDEVRKAAEEKIEINRRTEEQITREQQEAAAQRREIMFAAMDFAAEVSDFLFGLEQNRLQRELEELTVKQEEETALVGDNEQAQAFIRNKYATQEKEIKRKQAVADKEAAIFRASMAGAQAVLQALASAPPPANAILAAISGGLAAIQIAAIAAQPIPKYRFGTPYVQGPGTTTSDSIPALLSKGERVVPADVNRDYYPVLDAIQYRRVAPAVLEERYAPVTAASKRDRVALPSAMDPNAHPLTANPRSPLQTVMLPRIAPDVLQHIDRDSRPPRNAEVNTDKIVEAIKTMTLHRLSLDEDGFSKYIEREGNRTKYLDSRYSWDM